MSTKSLEDKVRDNVASLRSDPDNMEQIKDIVCVFYRDGKNSGCRGCIQPMETLVQCREDYLMRIEARPMEKWSAEFELKTVRPKKKLQEITIGLNCDKCYMATSCPEYEPLSMCSIDWDEDDDKDPKKALETLISLQSKRVKMHAKNEELEGGTPDQILSGEMDRLTRMLQIRTDLDASKFKLTVESTQRSGGGLLASLFGGGQKQETAPALPEAQPTITIPTADEVQFTEEIVLDGKKKGRKSKEV